MKTSTFTRDGVRLAYAENGAGQPFIFQHGLGADSRQTFELLGESSGTRLIAMDARAHGSSEVGPEQDIGFDTFGQDLHGLFEATGISKAVVGGLSMGAGISLNFALKYPGIVSSLILVRPAWVDAPMEARELYFAVASAIRQHGAARGRDAFLASEVYRQASAQFPDTAKSLLGQFDSARAEDGVARLERMPSDAPDHDRNRWSALKIPVLVLAHEDDPVHPLACGLAIAGAIPGARFVEITPKSVDRERHEAEIRKEIATFLERLPNSPMLSRAQDFKQ
jgi:pimeloyl-ACP methyl ester carboxylesterase